MFSGIQTHERLVEGQGANFLSFGAEVGTIYFVCSKKFHHYQNDVEMVENHGKQPLNLVLY